MAEQNERSDRQALLRQTRELLKSLGLPDDVLDGRPQGVQRLTPGQLILHF